MDWREMTDPEIESVGRSVGGCPAGTPEQVAADVRVIAERV